jgi:PAS domain S-box-containing protein
MKNKKIRVGLVLFDPKHAFFGSLTVNCFEIEAANLGMALRTYPVDSLEEQIALILRLSQGEVDALVVSPMSVDNPRLLHALSQVASSGVQVIVVNSPLNADIPITTVATDNAGGQAEVAEYVFKQLGGRGKVAYFQGDVRIGAGAARTNSFYALLEQYPEIELVYENMLDWQAKINRVEQAAVFMREVLAICPEVQAVICANDEGALGALSILEKNGMTGKVLVSGFNGVAEALVAIHEGRMLVTGQQVARELACKALAAVVEVQEGKPRPGLLSIPINLLNKANVADAAIETARMIPGIMRSLVNGVDLQRKLQQDVIDNQYRILQTMTSVSQIMSSAREIEDLTARVTRLVRERFDLHSVAFYMGNPLAETDAPNYWLSLRAYCDTAGITSCNKMIEVAEDSLLGTTIRLGVPYITNDKEQLQELAGTLSDSVCAQAGFPLHIGDQVIGVLALESKHPHAFKAETESVLQTIADQVAVSVKSASLYAQQRNTSTFLDSVLDNIPTALVVKDAKTLRYVLWNKASEDLYGEPRLNRLGKSAYDIYSKEVADEMVKRDADVITGGEISEYSERTITTPVKGERTLHIKKIPIADADNQIRFLVSMFDDVTDMKEGERALALRAAQLEQANQALRQNQDQLLVAEKMASIGRLTAGIAHEMNTPLAAVRSSLSELTSLVNEYDDAVGDPDVNEEDHHEIAAEMRQAIELASTSTERAAGFVRGVKSQTRDLSAKQMVAFNAVPIIDEAILLLSHMLREKKCTVNFDHISSLMELKGSPGRLAQVVTNLVVNSADACAPRGDGKIEVKLIEDGAFLVMTVTDNGGGIPPEIITRIFEPMFTTKPFGQGTGLGLPIVHDIVVGDFGGKIDVTSNVGEGTTFTLRMAKPTTDA